jgi:diguanylate cyclase (GGDEF)-like protein
MNQEPIARPETADRPSASDLSRLHLLRGADIESLAGLLEACPIRTLHAAEILVAPGQPSRAVYLVVRGQLRVHFGMAGSAPAAFLEAGESVGELCVLGEMPASMTVVAETDARVLVIDEPVFWSMTRASHAVACNVLTNIGRSLRQSGERTSEIGERLRRVHDRNRLVDELTGLHNRRWLDGVLARLVLRSSVSHEALSLVLLQIDDFQDYHKQFGDAAVNAAVYAVARTLQESLRPTDVVAHFGEKEFAVLLPYTDRSRALIVAERVREAITATTVVMDDGSLLPSVTATFGVVEMVPNEHADKLLTRAASDLSNNRARRRDQQVASGAIPSDTDPRHWIY